MYRCCLVIAAFAVALPAAAAAARPYHIDARLVTETAAPKPGRIMLVGLQMVPQPGWHGYWSNPGDSGLAPTVTWSAPHGVHFGPLQHPAPTLMQVSGLASYVHAGPHVLITRVRLDSSIPIGTALPITADVHWAACSANLCVPQKARLTVRLKAGRGTPSPEAALLRQAIAAEPKTIAPGTFRLERGQIVLQVPASARLNPRRTRFFPDDNGYWDPLKARVVSHARLQLASPLTGKVPDRVNGVLSDGSSAYQIRFRRQPTRR